MMSLNVEGADAWWEHIEKEGFQEKVSRDHVQAAGNAALGTAGALPERSHRRSLAPLRQKRLLTSRLMQ